MKDLSHYRVEIDSIDKEIMELFEKRMETVGNVALYKKENNMQIFQKDREQEVIIKNVARLENKNLEAYATEMLQTFMEVSKKYQLEKISFESSPIKYFSDSNKIGFFGVHGSFTEEALINFFVKADGGKNYDEIEDIFIAVNNGEIEYGVIPIENSSTGAITQVYDLFRKYNAYIVGETKVRIVQNLLGLPTGKISDLTNIFSHQQGFEQCKDFLKTLPDIHLIPYHNTAISAKHVKDSNDITKGAIGSGRAAKVYGLEILKAEINDNRMNFTRFAIIGKKLDDSLETNKISIIFSIANKAGSLFEILQILSDAKINMSKIESRPVGDGTFSYYFYVDLVGNINDGNTKTALDKVSSISAEFRMLGTYVTAD